MSSHNPSSWPEAIRWLDRLLSPDKAEVWLRVAVRSTYHVNSLHDLAATDRALVFQKLCLVIRDCELDGLPLDGIGPDGHLDWLLWEDGSFSDPEPDRPLRRIRIAEIFQRHFPRGNEG